MGNGGKGRGAVAKHPRCPWPFVSLTRCVGVENGVEVWIVDVEFVGVDADYWAYEENVLEAGGEEK